MEEPGDTDDKEKQQVQGNTHNYHDRMQSINEIQLPPITSKTTYELQSLALLPESD